ncbi:class I SAM-dependent methyltransferase [Coraliomargarita parva]|uniref:class I SAM-dependent methyltransferase n=1 Tax=Coraliomargarita parva TaxID=3014050 RepID=UPI0022B4FF38|nr:class I SAM-dependent methyltransferase [Coraliomargarita parva]
MENIIQVFKNKLSALLLGQRHDLGHGRERQVATKLRGIRSDHLDRYRFACKQGSGAMRILDIACGVGYGSFLLSRNFPAGRIDSVDLSAEAIDFARTYYNSSNIEYFTGDALSFRPSAKYDLIVSFETLEHIDDEKSYILHLRELLADKGRFIVSTPNERHYPLKDSGNPFHFRHHTPEQLTCLLEENGWRVVGKYSQSGKRFGRVQPGVEGRFLVFVAERSDPA